MQLNRCPSCHSRISIEHMAQDKSATDLLGLLIDLPEGIGRVLVVYLGLFRSSKRDLANDRALKLANELLALTDEKQRLSIAMTETIQAMRLKQEQGTFKPLSNHNYLKRVLETVSLQPAVNTALTTTQTAITAPARQSKSAQTIDFLKNYPTPQGTDEWFTRTICGALSEMMIMGLEGVPAADTMNLVVERFLTELWPKREWQRQHPYRGAERLRYAFIETAETNKRWPTVKDILAMVPRR